MIDLNDSVHKETTRHGKIVKNRLYRHSCDNCGADRGYQAKSFVTKKCNKCSKKGTVINEDTRSKMKAAAVERYSNPDWKPKAKKQAKTGQRRSHYKSSTSRMQARLKRSMKDLLWQKIKRRSINKSGTTFDILGYSADDVIKSIESKFQPGMTWDNYGKYGWHIDHAIPDSWFNYTSLSDDDFKKSWHLDNLQPMWAEHNLSKGSRYSGEYNAALRK